jgi:hypothetical protein
MTKAQLMKRYLAKHKKLIMPRQGWESLHRSLHLAYSMGRVRGFTDLGTYVNKPGDHGWRDDIRQAAAFDLGRKDRFYNRGWNYLTARKLALLYVEHHEALEIEYVILGMRIWSRSWAKAKRGPKAWSKDRGWHEYQGDTSHMFHVHVSGSVAHNV